MAGQDGGERGTSSAELGKFFRQPVQSLVQTRALGCAGALDVPLHWKERLECSDTRQDCNHGHLYPLKGTIFVFSRSLQIATLLDTLTHLATWHYLLSAQLGLNKV